MKLTVDTFYYMPGSAPQSQTSACYSIYYIEWLWSWLSTHFTNARQRFPISKSTCYSIYYIEWLWNWLPRHFTMSRQAHMKLTAETLPRHCREITETAETFHNMRGSAPQKELGVALRRIYWDFSKVGFIVILYRQSCSEVTFEKLSAIFGGALPNVVHIA